MTAASPALAGPHQQFETQIRWRSIEFVFWLATLLPFVVTPDYLVLASQIAITALFALSLDLILGYAGIVSLGHAAFFGFGAYTAGLIAIVLGALLVFFMFPRFEVEQQMLARFKEEDAKSVPSQESAGGGS